MSANETIAVSAGAETESETNKRVAALRAKMKEKGMDAYIIPTADFHGSEYIGDYFKTREYVTGFTGSAGTAVVTMTDAGLWTDGRYFVQAGAELAGSCVELMRMGKPEVPTVKEFLYDKLPEGGVLGFDGRVFNGEDGNDIEDYLSDKKITIACQEDLVDAIWENRPAMVAEPIWILDVCYAGVSGADKLAKLRGILAEKRVDYHIITTLDEIAWLFNLRGNDIQNNPVFLSNAIIGRDSAVLYVQKKAVSPEVQAYLEAMDVEIREYDQFLADAMAISDQRVLLEKKKVGYSLCIEMEKKNRVKDEMNPCAILKAVKNETEIENMKRAHLKDGIAVTKFMYWLKHTIGKEPLTEMTAANKVEELRDAQGGYLGPSFNTIAAYGANAAMCHYHPTPECYKELKPEGMLLVDSGGQFYEGTTDITRTYALGPITDEEKEYYTIVAASMLKACRMKFLHGCRGLNLDYVIREAFWQRGLDFNHGTGHGVGFLLNVHERPNGIRWKVVPEREDSNIIEPGMICSDEPGLYFADRFGVRSENLILCVPAEKNEYGQFLKFEFLTWSPLDLDAMDVKYLDEHDLENLNWYHAEVYERLAPYMEEEERIWLKEVTRPLTR